MPARRVEATNSDIRLWVRLTRPEMAKAKRMAARLRITVSELVRRGLFDRKG
jgi:hypothetical protein